MSELKLLPCPFCGGEADIEEIPGSPFTNEPYTWAVGCKACNIGWYEETQAEATSKWNRRAQPENSRQHALQTGVCPMCEDCPDGCPVETPNDSRNRPENEPLTLDELRQMDGDPVWIQESAPYTFAGYKILCSPVVDEYEDVCFEGGDCYYSHDYGKAWLAYRAKPERSEG